MTNYGTVIVKFRLSPLFPSKKNDVMTCAFYQESRIDNNRILMESDRIVIEGSRTVISKVIE